MGLYDAIADAADLDAVFAIEALANPRLRDEIGELQLVPPEERVSGPGATPVMAAFTHLNPEGSRFSDGSYGVYYAAHSLATAVAEVSHHRALFLRRTDEPAIDLDMRLDHRQRRGGAARPAHPGQRAAGGAAVRGCARSRRTTARRSALGGACVRQGSWGISYPSVRDAEGECVAIFRPQALRHAKSALHIALHWDGERITHWFEKRAPHPLTTR